MEGAWVSGALGAAFLFLSASVPGDRGGSFSLQGIAHAVFFITAGLGMVGQAACTVAATCKARCGVSSLSCLSSFSGGVLSEGTLVVSSFGLKICTRG